MKATKEEAEEHLCQGYSDPRRDDSLEEIEKLINPKEPATPFRVEELSWQDLNTFLRKARVKSAPGPNGIPYKVYKHC